MMKHLSICSNFHEARTPQWSVDSQCGHAVEWTRGQHGVIATPTQNIDHDQLCAWYKLVDSTKARAHPLTQRHFQSLHELLDTHFE